MIEEIKEMDRALALFLIGKRIRLTSMPHEPLPVPIGTHGIILEVRQFEGWSQVQVAWDNKSTLMLAIPPDTFILDPIVA